MLRLFYAVLLLWSLTGCEDGIKESSIDQGALAPAAATVFDSTSGDIPYPNDILFAGSTDGTLNIEFDPADSDAAVKEALNALDGFSTISPISVGVTGTLDPDTLPGHVRLFEVISAASEATGFIPAVGAVTGELTFGVDFVATVSGERLVILPLKPLASHGAYMVVLTDGIADSGGAPLVPDAITTMLNGTQALIDADGPTVYFDADAATNVGTATKLEGLRQLTQAMIAQAGTQDIARDDIIMAWSFTTQTIGAVQTALAASTMTATLGLAPTGAATDAFVPTLNGVADVYVGTLSDLPQYMPQGSASDPLPALNGQFSFTGASKLPNVEKADATIPVFATVPNAAAAAAFGCSEPAAGWPVVIYQHGITRQRSDLLAYAETFAAKCFAAIAIDLPLHGISDTSSPLYMAGLERTFDIDVLTEDDQGNTLAAEPDGIIDSSGASYVNLAHLSSTRDNMHHTTSDLLQLEAALGTAAGVAFDTANIHFVSHSLGNIAAIGYLNHTTALKTATLAMPGQGVIEVMNNSAVFGPAIEAGLAANGVIKGTAAYDSFMLASQTIIDDADPANYTIGIGEKTLPILEFEAIGDGTEGSGDQHIPSSIATAPLSGGDPFIRFTQALDINTSATVSTPDGDVFIPTTTKTVTRLTAGEHRSPLDPQYSVEATTEIHTQMISFISSLGNAIIVTDPSIIK